MATSNKRTQQRRAHHVGATGPRYTKAQIRKAISLRKKGQSWGSIAEAVGVKSPAYFSQTVRATHGSDPKVS